MSSSLFQHKARNDCVWKRDGNVSFVSFSICVRALRPRRRRAPYWLNAMIPKCLEIIKIGKTWGKYVENLYLDERFDCIGFEENLWKILLLCECFGCWFWGKFTCSIVLILKWNYGFRFVWKNKCFSIFFL